ncbi:uncharacterized protein LOC141639693 [Silene latifolia]|uniref:uncharacterized protein LOC141639693 n=1 Tax=Silene latifolia TaxID=37657 RepID=UPI003D782451
MGKYLGLPTDIGISDNGKSKRDIFNFLIDNVKKRTSSWNSLLLSSAGRLSLISSILSSLSTYFLSVFKMPALLAKIGWNILRNPSSLISRTIGVELGLDWFNCINRVEAVKSNDSWICKGILWGAKIFTKNIAWIIGSESILNISSNNKDDFAFWKLSKNGNYYVKKGYFDAWQDFWNLKASIKDLSRISSGCRTFIKKRLWHLPGPKKWIILLWKILTQTLPVGREFDKRGIGDGLVCRLCDKQCMESLEHLFRDCEYVSRLWSATHLGINANSGSNISIQEWIINWLSLLLRKENTIDGVISFMCTLWIIWVTRNRQVFGKEPLSPFGSIRLYEHELSSTLFAEKARADKRKVVNIIRLLDDCEVNLQALHYGNAFPLIGPILCEDHFLIYTDAAWRSDFSTGLGWAVKNSNDIGSTIFTNLKSNCYAQSASQAEALAILEALNWARRSQLLHVCVYSDCLQVVAQLLDFTPVNIDTKVIVSDILRVGCYFHCLSFCYVPRSCNKMAHRLAKRAIST